MTTVPGSNLPDINKGPSILAACGVTTLLALSTVLARIWVRVTMVHSVGLDDYAIIIAMALSLAGMCLIIPEVQNGAGRHILYLNPAKAIIGLKINFATQPVFLWAITTVKVSIGLFLLRFAPAKGYRKLLLGIIFFLLLYTTACFMTLILQCKNLAILWDPTVKTTCWKPTTLRALSYLNSSLNIATDLFFAILPIPIVYGLQINRRLKSSLICIMGLGVFACAASLVKISYVPSYGKTGDFLWDSTNLTIWTVIECNTGIIAASLPCLKPLFRRILEKSWPGYGSNRTNSHYLHNFPPGSNPGLKSQRSIPGTFITSRSRNSRHQDLEASSVEDILPLGGKSTIKITSMTVNSSGSRHSETTSWPIKNDAVPEREVEDRV